MVDGRIWQQRVDRAFARVREVEDALALADAEGWSERAVQALQEELRRAQRERARLVAEEARHAIEELTGGHAAPDPAH